VVAAGLTQSTRFRRTSAKPWLDDLEAHSIEIIAGPAPRHTTDGFPSCSIDFRDLDGNLLELMAAG